MAGFGWLRRLFGRSPAKPAPASATPTPAPRPESAWRIDSEGGTLTMTAPDGRTAAVAIAQLSAIAIEAHEGETGIDLWWLFYGPEEDVAFALPFGAWGEGEMVERVAALPGFRHAIYADAVRAADLDTFVVWSRPLD